MNLIFEKRYFFEKRYYQSKQYYASTLNQQMPPTPLCMDRPLRHALTSMR